MSSLKESRKRKPRNAIRLFIGYEEDAEELVKKFVQMKKKYEFQNTVDLFSWLLQLGEQAEKPPNIPKKAKLSEQPKTNIQSPTSVTHKTSRRKQQNPLKANLVNQDSTDNTGNVNDKMLTNENYELFEEQNGCVVVQSDEKEIENYVNGFHDQDLTIIMPE